MKPMTPISCTRQAITIFSSMPARTACLALCSKWLAGANRYLKKCIRVRSDEADDSDIVHQAGHHDLLVHAGSDRVSGTLQQVVGGAKSVLEEVHQGQIG